MRPRSAAPPGSACSTGRRCPCVDSHEQWAAIFEGPDCSNERLELPGPTRRSGADPRTHARASTTGPSSRPHNEPRVTDRSYRRSSGFGQDGTATPLRSRLGETRRGIAGTALESKRTTGIGHETAGMWPRDGTASVGVRTTTLGPRVSDGRCGHGVSRTSVCASGARPRRKRNGAKRTGSSGRPLPNPRAAAGNVNGPRCANARVLDIATSRTPIHARCWSCTANRTSISGSELRRNATGLGTQSGRN